MGSLQRSSRPASRFYGRGRAGENRMGRIGKEDEIGSGEKGKNRRAMEKTPCTKFRKYNGM